MWTRLSRCESTTYNPSQASSYRAKHHLSPFSSVVFLEILAIAQYACRFKRCYLTRYEGAALCTLSAEQPDAAFITPIHLFGSIRTASKGALALNCPIGPSSVKTSFHPTFLKLIPISRWTRWSWSSMCSPASTWTRKSTNSSLKLLQWRYLEKLSSSTHDTESKTAHFPYTFQEEPYLKTNLEVHGARNLLGKDMTGQSDPFCTFYLTTNPHARYIFTTKLLLLLLHLPAPD